MRSMQENGRQNMTLCNGPFQMETTITCSLRSTESLITRRTRSVAHTRHTLSHTRARAHRTHTQVLTRDTGTQFSTSHISHTHSQDTHVHQVPLIIQCSPQVNDVLRRNIHIVPLCLFSKSYNVSLCYRSSRQLSHTHLFLTHCMTHIISLFARTFFTAQVGTHALLQTRRAFTHIIWGYRYTLHLCIDCTRLNERLDLLYRLWKEGLFS